MNKKTWTGLAVIGAVLVGAALWQPWSAAPGTGQRPATDGPSAWFTAQPPGASAATSGDAGAASTPAPASPLDSMTLPTFRADAKGALVTDAQTRVDIERIQAVYERDQAQAVLAQLTAGLPQQAQRQLHDLYQRHAQYSQAVAQALPPEHEGQPSMDEALQQLDVLHGLRDQYFGAEAAQAMFGDEEKTARELIELMRQQTDPKLSLEEKAERAQAAWKKQHPD